MSPPVDADAAAPWWPVGTTKFAVMTLGTLGLYHLYWFYENLKRLRERGMFAGSPVWRTFFAPFTAYWLVEPLRREASLRMVKADWSAVGIAIAYFVANGALAFGVPLWLAGPVVLLPMLPVQRTMMRLNAVTAPRAPRNDRISVFNAVMLLLGIALTYFVYWADQYVQRLLQEWLP